MTSGPQKQTKASLPKTVNIVGIQYDIIVDAEVFYKKIVEIDDLNLIGYCDSQGARILLKPGLARAIEKDTLTHEIAHAVWAAVGLGEIKAADDDQEEVIISTFVPSYNDTINRNPNLRKYLFDD